MAKSIILKHIELMAICQSHSFEIFVSLSNLIRFYTYIVSNVFMSKRHYDILMNDVTMYGYYPDSEGNQEMSFTGEERDRTNQLMQVQQRYELLRDEISNMQSFAETYGYAASDNHQNPYLNQSSDQSFELIHKNNPSILQALIEGNNLNLQKALFFSLQRPS